MGENSPYDGMIQLTNANNRHIEEWAGSIKDYYMI